ncbi:MAG: hypothetical protein ACW98X_23300, partial [Promethearchaeota archaeon]
MTEEYNEATVSSSIFYAKKNTPSKQNLLLQFDQETNAMTQAIDKKAENSSEIIESSIYVNLKDSGVKGSSKIASKKPREVTKAQKPKFIHNVLSQYYPELPESDKSNSKKLRPKKFTTKASPTKLLLTSALKKTKMRIKEKSKKKEPSKPVADKNTLKKSITQLKFTTRRLNDFVSVKRIKIDIKKKPQKIGTPGKPYNKNKYEQESLVQKVPQINETDPFPFTNLSEWLIWHRNYPELAYVREAFDVEEVPDDS